MARNSFTSQELKTQGEEALEQLRYEEAELQKMLLEIQEYKPEATLEDAKQMLRERRDDMSHCDVFDDGLGFLSSSREYF